MKTEVIGNRVRCSLIVSFSFLLLFSCTPRRQPSIVDTFKPGEIWPDTEGEHINAHGGGILYHDGTYYWFGEHKGEGNNALIGVMCYSSEDLYNWKNEGVALAVSEDPDSDIVRGCVMERPKVVFNRKTGKFVMWFHLELKGQGYNAARTGVAISDSPTGSFKYIKSLRPNAGYWPENFKDEWKIPQPNEGSLEQWTDDWREAVEKGLYVRRDYEKGQMSRDMTVFVDHDDKAYHIHSAEENLTLNISELTDDYLDFTGKWVTMMPGGHNEAPAIVKKESTYYMITSGCTGWDPNAARSFKSKSIFGPWEALGNPCVGEGSDLTFDSQSTFIIPFQGKENAYIFMADRWHPSNPIDGRYIWLPLQFVDGKPVLQWYDQWSLDVFD
ncbi:MAG: glycoside hydrolase family 43 protein [Cyclobacteriaceae bacterium]